MPLNSYESRAQSLLANKLDARITAIATSLANGDARNIGDVAATAQTYSEQIGYIRALRDVLTLCQEVEDELLGRKKK